jgi:hypothetical protein
VKLASKVLTHSGYVEATHSYSDGHGSNKHAGETSPDAVNCAPHEDPTDEAEDPRDEQVWLSAVTHDRERVRDAATATATSKHHTCASLALHSGEKHNAGQKMMTQK